MTDGYATTGAGLRVELMRRDRYDALLSALEMLTRYRTRLALTDAGDHDRVFARFESAPDGPWVPWSAIEALLRQHREER